MPLYNHVTNDLPVPPKWYADWREVYAKVSSHLATDHTDVDLFQREVCFMPDPLERNYLQAREDEELNVIRLPYYKIAHYAAREQTEYNAKNPPLDFDDLRTLEQCFVSGINQNNVSPYNYGRVKKWLNARLDEAYEKLKKRRR